MKALIGRMTRKAAAAGELAVVGWYTSFWAFQIGIALTKEASRTERFKTTWSTATRLGHLASAKRSEKSHLLVLLPPTAPHVAEVIHWINHRRDTDSMDVALVDCCIESLDAAVGVAMALPRWPTAWLPTATVSSEGISTHDDHEMNHSSVPGTSW